MGNMPFGNIDADIPKKDFRNGCNMDNTKNNRYQMKITIMLFFLLEHRVVFVGLVISGTCFAETGNNV
jgi:hypothetical protein